MKRMPNPGLLGTSLTRRPRGLAFGGRDEDMNSGAMSGWIGGIVGGILGLVGGIIWTYFSIKNTYGPLERSFMIKSAVVSWIAILVFLGLLLGLPDPYRLFTWIPYIMLATLGILFRNRKQEAIRRQESQNKTSEGICR